MTSQINVNEQILVKAEELFMKWGFIRVTVEEISHELGISKKTIYKYFKNKDDLIKSTLKKNIQYLSDQCDELINDAQMDFIDKINIHVNRVTEILAKLSGPVLDDLKRGNPAIWHYIDDLKKTNIMPRTVKLLDQGLQLNIVRNDIPIEIMHQIFMKTVETLITPELLSIAPYTGKEVFEAIVKILYGGILSDTGRKAFLEKSAPKASESL